MRFAASVARERGHVSDAALQAVKSAGYGDAQVMEIVVHVALNTLTNYVNEVAQTDVDFPAVDVKRRLSRRYLLLSARARRPPCRRSRRSRATSRSRLRSRRSRRAGDRARRTRGWSRDRVGTRRSRASSPRSSPARPACSSARRPQPGSPTSSTAAGRPDSCTSATRTLAFADYRGNRQFVTQGNLAENPRAHLFLIDYGSRQRVKLWGEARVVEDDAALLADLLPQGARPRGEQALVFRVLAWDANCPKHIPHRFEAAAVAQLLEERDRRIAELEAEIARLVPKGRDEGDRGPHSVRRHDEHGR